MLANTTFIFIYALASGFGLPDHLQAFVFYTKSVYNNVRVTVEITVLQNYNIALTQYLVWDPMYIKEVFLN